MFANLIILMPNFLACFDIQVLDSGDIFKFSGSVSVKYTLLGVLDYLSKQMSKSGFSYPDRILVGIQDFQEQWGESQRDWDG